MRSRRMIVVTRVQNVCTYASQVDADPVSGRIPVERRHVITERRVVRVRRARVDAQTSNRVASRQHKL